jgi:transketolase
MDVWRPCDTVETAVAWVAAIERRDGPTSLALSRQNVPFVEALCGGIAAIRRGGYVIAEAADAPAPSSSRQARRCGSRSRRKRTSPRPAIATRVVSMPCTSLFDRQDDAWKASVLPQGVPRVSIEAGVTDFWRKYVGLEGAAIGVDRFGESAPAPDVYKFLGVDAAHLVEAVKSVV